MQQPLGMSSKENAHSILLEKLSESPYADYEVSDLLQHNIPYFYHVIGQGHLYDGNGKEYRNVFSEPATLGIRRQFFNRSPQKMYFDCEIIRKHLTLPSIRKKVKTR